MRLVRIVATDAADLVSGTDERDRAGCEERVQLAAAGTQHVRGRVGASLAGDGRGWGGDGSWAAGGRVEL